MGLGRREDHCNLSLGDGEMVGCSLGYVYELDFPGNLGGLTGDDTTVAIFHRAFFWYGDV